MSAPPPGLTQEEFDAYIEKERKRRKAVATQFVAGKAAMFSNRQHKSPTIHESLKSMNTHDADQGQVWDEVQQELASAGVTSRTSALSDLYAARERELAEFRGKLRLPDDAVGLAVFHGGAFQGLDLFDRHSTLKYFWDSLVDSYALSWLNQREPAHDMPDRGPDEDEATRDLFDQAAGTQWEGFDSPGEGRDSVAGRGPGGGCGRGSLILRAGRLAVVRAGGVHVPARVVLIQQRVDQA